MTWVLAALLVCGCGGGKPASQEKSGAETNKKSTAVASGEPALESVPEQTEPGDGDFPRGAEAFAAVIAAAKSNDAEGWTKAEEKLQALGAQATAALAARLDDQDSVARELAAMFLAQIGPDASSAAPGLVKVLEDESTFARVNAAAALSTFEGYEEQVTPVLTQLLLDADENVRLTATRSLRNVGPAAAKSVRSLTKVLSDPNPEIRAAAATTLGEIGSAAAVTLPALRHLAEDSDGAVAAAATRAIRRLDELARDTGTIPASGIQ